MAKDLEFGSDVHTDLVSDTSDDSVGKDLNGDLANDKGVDLNTSESQHMAKATMMMCEAPPPENYITMAVTSPDSAYYTEAPEHVGRSPEQVASEMFETFQDGDPAPDTRGIENQQPHEPDYGELDD